MCCNYKRVSRNDTHFRNHATTNSQWLLLSFRTFALPLFLTSLSSNKSTSMEERMVFLSALSSLCCLMRTCLSGTTLICLMSSSEAIRTKSFSKHLLHCDLFVNRCSAISRKVVSIAESTSLLGWLLPTFFLIARWLIRLGSLRSQSCNTCGNLSCMSFNFL